ncbi:hypothetical protein [Carboxylicivirga linearis]|uniref:Lipoprotein n=1 Tax=Carboxylicivirga linearis TaxID=1628157 RepID=A0ABS5JVY8_9BACT|nr:hypothetical protein [Carboxylicivirga linearis]MBS2098501.1 hypothetical protein [Carboxylicivirga linearis]
MKSLFKNLALGLVLMAGVSLVSCSSDTDNYTPSDDVVDRPIPNDPDTEYAPQRPTPGGPNPEA